LRDPDGHTLELSYGQEVGLITERSADNNKFYLSWFSLIADNCHLFAIKLLTINDST